MEMALTEKLRCGKRVRTLEFQPMVFLGSAIDVVVSIEGEYQWYAAGHCMRMSKWDHRVVYRNLRAFDPCLSRTAAWRGVIQRTHVLAFAADGSSIVAPAAALETRCDLESPRESFSSVGHISSLD